MEKIRLPIAGEASPDDTALLGLPPLAPALAMPIAADVSAGVRELLVAVLGALEGARAADETAIFSVRGAAMIHEVTDALGRGEVELEVEGTSLYRVSETALAGVWRVETIDRDGDLASFHIEVGELPRVVRAANDRATFDDIDAPAPPPGVMNAPSLVAEIAHAMKREVERGRPNHVINFTLLPVTAEDMAYLGVCLGRGPVEGDSRGYGRCRVRLTARRNVWSVTYFNSMGAAILDTLEVGDVPAALLAADEDLEDSAVRLRELLEAYR